MIGQYGFGETKRRWEEEKCLRKSFAHFGIAAFEQV